MLPSGRDKEDPTLSDFRVVGNALSRIVTEVVLLKCKEKRTSQQGGMVERALAPGEADLGSPPNCQGLHDLGLVS